MQNLLPGVFERRRTFCRWFLDRVGEDDQFPTIVLAADESTFTRSGIFNFHNSHAWEPMNPHNIVTGHFQHELRLNIWAGVVGDHLLGPHILPARLNSAKYARFLRRDLPLLLEDVCLATRRNMWLLHDGAPVHMGRAIPAIQRIWGNRVIARNGAVAWPPRSPDLNPMDFYVWGHMKSLVYTDTEFETLEELRGRVFHAGNVIREQPGIFARVRDNWLRRCQACLDANGNHFEHLL